MGAVGLEQRGRRLHRLQELGLGAGADGRGVVAGGDARRRGGGRVGVGDGLGVDAELLGDRLVEAVLALEQLVDAAQERAGLCALNDAVVIGRGHRHRLGDAERPDPVLRRVGPLGGVGEGAAGDDRPLAAHQAGDRGDGAQAARVGQRDVGPGEVVGHQLVLAGLGDQVLVVGVEAGEVEPVGALDAGDHQAARAVLALDVDGDAEVDGAGVDDEGLAVALLIGAGHRAPLLGGLDDRPGDQVGERELHAALLERRVEDLALGVDRVDRDGAEGGRGGDRAALVHRRGEHAGGAAQRSRLGLPGRCGGGGAGRRRAVGRRQHVGLGHLAADATAADRRRVDAVCRGVRSPRGLWPRCAAGVLRPRRGALGAAASAEPRQTSASGAAGFAAGAGASPASSSARAVPTGTVSSGWARILTIFPLVGAGTSASTLSVEISTTVWPSCTDSPSATCHSSTVPSVTDSPISGISTVAVSGIARNTMPCGFVVRVQG